MAEINPSKTIVVSYDMYTEFEGVKELVEVEEKILENMLGASNVLLNPAS